MIDCRIKYDNDRKNINGGERKISCAVFFVFFAKNDVDIAPSVSDIYPSD